VSEKLGNLALLREKILSLEVELPPEIERKLTELYPAIEKIRQKPSEENRSPYGVRNSASSVRRKTHKKNPTISAEHKPRFMIFTSGPESLFP